MGTEKRITLRFNTAGLSAIQQGLIPLLVSEGRITEQLIMLEEAEQAEFAIMLNEAIEEVNREHTRLVGLMGQALKMPVKQLMWETNHLKITKTIVSSLSQTGRMPSQAYIAAVTGLSRKTVQDHIVEGNDTSVYIEHLRQYTMMAPRVMDTVLNEAVLKRDMKAARMYFDILEKMRGSNAPNIYAGQNNYIYINNYVIRQESLQRLSDEQLKQIVEMVRKKEEDEVGQEVAVEE